MSTKEEQTLELLKRCNIFMSKANKYLFDKNKVALAEREAAQMQRLLSALELVKNNTPLAKLNYDQQSPILEKRITRAESDARSAKRAMRENLPLVHASHQKLLSALGGHCNNGQQVFRLPSNGLSKVSYTRHIKQGSGYSLIYGPRLPVMNYA